jgi:hypothetical protein
MTNLEHTEQEEDEPAQVLELVIETAARMTSPSNREGGREMPVSTDPPYRNAFHTSLC